MHIASNDLALNGGERIYDLDRLLDRPMRLLEPFASPETDEFNRLQERVQNLRETVAKVPIDSDSFGPIHGDIHRGNCDFTPEGKI